MGLPDPKKKEIPKTIVKGRKFAYFENDWNVENNFALNSNQISPEETVDNDDSIVKPFTDKNFRFDDVKFLISRIPKESKVYICGPPEMNKLVYNNLRGIGFDELNLHLV